MTGAPQRVPNGASGGTTAAPPDEPRGLAAVHPAATRGASARALDTDATAPWWLDAQLALEQRFVGAAAAGDFGARPAASAVHVVAALEDVVEALYALHWEALDLRVRGELPLAYLVGDLVAPGGPLHARLAVAYATCHAVLGALGVPAGDAPLVDLRPLGATDIATFARDAADCGAAFTRAAFEPALARVVPHAPSVVVRIVRAAAPLEAAFAALAAALLAARS